MLCQVIHRLDSIQPEVDHDGIQADKIQLLIELGQDKQPRHQMRNSALQS